MPATPRRRGRPRQAKPTGTWSDSDVLAQRVSTIVGDRDVREDSGVEAYEQLCRLARRLLCRRVTPEERTRLKELLFTKKAKASVITRQLLGWKHGLGLRDVRRMERSLRAPISLDSTALVLKYAEDGQPVCDEHGQPQWWIPDENGKPARRFVAGEESRRPRVKVVRPRVKLLIYR